MHIRATHIHFPTRTKGVADSGDLAEYVEMTHRNELLTWHEGVFTVAVMERSAMRMLLLGCIVACSAVKALDSGVSAPADVVDASAARAVHHLRTISSAQKLKLDLAKASDDAARLDGSKVRGEKKIDRASRQAQEDRTVDTQTELPNNQDAMPIATAKATAAHLKKRDLEQRPDEELTTAMKLLAMPSQATTQDSTKAAMQKYARSGHFILLMYLPSIEN